MERDILKEYQDANLTKRLHLFLQYRDLRDLFQEIEAGHPSSQSEPALQETFRVRKHIPRYGGSLRAWVLHLFFRIGTK